MKTVLVVDDEPSLRVLYYKELSEEGYRVLVAADGEEAIQKVREEDIDLVVLDIRLEGRGGLEILGEMLVEKSDLRVLINTAYSSYAEHFASWLAEGYILKSSDLTELKARLRELLQ